MQKLKSFLIPLGILAIGVVGFHVLSSMRQAPKRIERPHQGPLVEAIAAPETTLRIAVEAQGTVQPDREIDLVPQVNGVVVWTSDKLETGAFFERGDVLARIDPEDYQLALDQAEAQVAQARYRLDIVHGEAAIARDEWERLAPEGVDVEPEPLVLQLPQQRSAAAELKAAEARLREVRLRLERTELKAPFSGRVRATQLEAGQYVNPGMPVAHLYSIEKAEIVVPVPDGDLAFIDVPVAGAQVTSWELMISQPDRDRQAKSEPPPVRVRARYAGRDHEWTGRVVRDAGEVDPRSRMVRLVVEVDDPYGGTGGTAPLVVGLFTDVEIAGREVAGVRRIPRSALHEGNTIWITRPGGNLRIRNVEMVRASRGEVLIRADLEPSDQVITTQLKGVTDGMKVRLSTGSGGGAASALAVSEGGQPL
ncbi:MAG: efflux RND transporter periplasmic adaptor subunit [Candidatus Latescibacterota bacterium]|nr:efflux RND transporter periplasmic adaptor subunit [Candidatus Latescibacterota bacterium]